MKHFLKLFIFSFIILNILSCSSEKTKKYSINFSEESFDKALIKAEQENKNIFIYFHADWCGYCKYMDENVLNTKKITKYINNKFLPISITINNENSTKLRKKYNINSYPTFLFIKPDQNEIERFSGKTEKDKFLILTKNVYNNKNTLSDNISKLNKNPDDINLIYKIFNKYKRRGDIKNLITYKNKIYETNSDFYTKNKEEIITAIADTYKKNNNFYLAKQYNDILLDEQFQKIKSRMIYNAQCLTNMKKYREAFDIYKNLIILLPNEISSYIDILKYSYSNRIMNDEAIKIAEKGLQIKSDNKSMSDFIFYLAKNNELINNNSLALDYINNALNNYKDKRLISYKIMLEKKIKGNDYYNEIEKIEIIPADWKFGKIEKDKIITNEIILINNSSQDMKLDIIKTCDCLEVSQTKMNIASSNSGILTITYNSENDEKEITREIIIREKELNIKKIFKISGYIETKNISLEKKLNDNKILTVSKQDKEITLFYYYVPSCHLCQDFINKQIPSLEKKLNININLELKDIYDDKNYNEYQAKLKELNVVERSIPILFINKDVLQGNKEIEKNVEKYILKNIQGNDINKTTENSNHKKGIKKEFSVLLALSTGFIDGINPCAFAALISLLIALTLAGRRRKEIFFMGIFFTLSVYVTYYLVGVGLFEGFKLLSVFNIAAVIIKWVMIVFLFVMAVLSIYDFYLIRIGKSNEIILQLPNFFKKRIKNTIKSNVKNTAVILSSITLGFLIALFELGCTGQVYLPFVIHLVRTEKNIGGFLLLGIYNLAFVTPLVIIFILTYFGLSSQKLTLFFQKQMGTIKILLACVFIALAVVTIVF